jgi:N-acetylmuramoyl-L-alanine amidase
VTDGRLRFVVDAGHGGADPGAVHAATGLREADVTLEIAHVLKAIMDTHSQVEAVLTRDSDRTTSLAERTELANARDAHLVSIHCNSSEDPRAKGAEVLCFTKTDPDGGQSPGYRIGAAIQKELVALGLRDRGVKPIYDRRTRKYVGPKLWVLRKTRRPSVLVETAFISNREEARLLGDDLSGFKARLAVAIFQGLRTVLLGAADGKPPSA